VVSVFARVGVLLAGWGVLGLAWAAVGSAVFTSLVFLVIQLRLLFTPRLVWDVRFVRRLLRPAMPLMLNNLLVTAAFSLDSFILRFYADDLAVAQYRMPYQVLSVALLLSPLLTNAVFPVIARYAEDDRSAFNRTYQRTLQVLLIAAFPITVATTILATDLVYFVVGGRAASSFVGASDVALAILIWFLPLSYLNGLTQYALIALNRQGWITRSFMVMAVFNAAGNLLLIPHFGMYAASVLTVLSEYCFICHVSSRATPRERWSAAMETRMASGTRCIVHGYGDGGHSCFWRNAVVGGRNSRLRRAAVSAGGIWCRGARPGQASHRMVTERCCLQGRRLGRSRK